MPVRSQYMRACVLMYVCVLMCVCVCARVCVSVSVSVSVSVCAEGSRFRNPYYITCTVITLSKD